MGVVDLDSWYSWSLAPFIFRWSGFKVAVKSRQPFSGRCLFLTSFQIVNLSPVVKDTLSSGL